MDRGGVESWLINLLRYVDRKQLQMDFCVLSGDKGVYDEEIRALGSQVIYCRNPNMRSYSGSLQKIFREGHYDAVHSHVWSFSGPVLKCAKSAGVPIRVAHSHNTKSKYPPSVYRKVYSWWTRRMILKYATHCLGCSSEAAGALFGSDWSKNTKCRVLYCSIDINPFSESQKPSIGKTDLGFPEDALVIGNVGNLRTQKNHTFFLDIAAEVVKKESRAYFFIAGEGELRPELEAQAQRLGIGNRVVFAGVRNDIPDLLRQVYDVFLFPSLYEGMPLALVEAAAAGLPVVYSDTITKEATTAIPELFTRLPLTASAEMWAQAVLTALQNGKIDPSKAYRLIRDSHFSPYYCLEELMKIYKCKRIGSVEKD
jgi:glycosyltransferase involved in cell wall biosynthesis